ncbi:hypothetical protein [Roseibium sp.]|uniref:hypothetical protein n=1 Tax=Roseibium sp. TaxID=1936156 RepID=UPI003A97E7CB
MADRYLVLVPGMREEELEVDLEKAGASESCWLQDDLALAVTQQTRSRFYHAIKRQIGKQQPLLVAPLASAPKFKGMAEGSTKWVRQHIR